MNGKSKDGKNAKYICVIMLLKTSFFFCILCALVVSNAHCLRNGMKTKHFQETTKQTASWPTNIRQKLWARNTCKWELFVAWRMCVWCLWFERHERHSTALEYESRRVCNASTNFFFRKYFCNFIATDRCFWHVNVLNSFQMFRFILRGIFRAIHYKCWRKRVIFV